MASQTMTIRSQPEHSFSTRLRVSVFANGQLTGQLIMTTAEYQIFGAALKLGADRTNGCLAVVIEESV